MTHTKEMDLLVRIYNAGYMAGHNATVESQFVDIHRDDMGTYHADLVAELLSELSPDYSIKWTKVHRQTERDCGNCKHHNCPPTDFPCCECVYGKSTAQAYTKWEVG